MGADLEVKVLSEVGHNNQAIFKVRGSTLEYKLIVANLENVVAAHIHCAPEGQTGPVGVTLFTGGPTTIAGKVRSLRGLFLPAPNQKVTE